MASSGTYTFDPNVAEVCEEAFERVGKDKSKLLQEDVTAARRSMNLMFVEWSNRGVKLWNVDSQAGTTATLVSGTATYTLAARTVAVLEAVRRDSNGNDVWLQPMSRSEWAALPDKDQAGLPTQFYFDRQTTPTLTLWPVINTTGYSLVYWRLKQNEDVGSAVNTLAIPYRWQEAVAAGLAARLAVKYDKPSLPILMPEAEKQFALAAGEETERGPTYIRPNLSGYRI